MKEKTKTKIKTILNFIYYSYLILFIIVYGYALAGDPQIAPPEVKKYPVMVINNSAPHTYWGIVKYKVDKDGQYYDYDVLNGDYKERQKLIELTPGWYAITQVRDVEYWYEPPNAKPRLLKFTQIVDYLEFEVTTSKGLVTIEFY